MFDKPCTVILFSSIPDSQTKFSVKPAVTVKNPSVCSFLCPIMSGFFIQSQISISYTAKYMFIGIDFDGAIWNVKFLLMPSQSSGT